MGCKWLPGKLPGEDGFLGLAGLADFLVGDDTDGHVFADLGGAGDGERGLVVVGELALADGDEFPVRFAFFAGVNVDGFVAGFFAGDGDAAALRFRLDGGAAGGGVALGALADPLELLADAGEVAGGGLGAADVLANEGEVGFQERLEVGDFSVHLLHEIDDGGDGGEQGVDLSEVGGLLGGAHAQGGRGGADGGLDFKPVAEVFVGLGNEVGRHNDLGVRGILCC